MAGAESTTVDELRRSPFYRPDHADVLRLYRAFFDREPDIEGAYYWLSQHEYGVATLEDMAWGFGNSEEFERRYGGAVGDRQFLEIVYGNVLGRAPDAPGMAYWLKEMSEGLGQHGVVRWVAANEEFILRHPYTDLSPDVGTVLPSLVDLPAGWYETEPPMFRLDHPCANYYVEPDRSIYRSFEVDPIAGPFLDVSIYAYPSTDIAGGRLGPALQVLAMCRHWFTDDIKVESTPMYLRLGDGSISERIIVTLLGTDLWGEDHHLVVHYGPVIFTLTHSAIGQGPIGSLLSQDDTLAWAELIIERLGPLIDP